jgi:cytochrome bd-type quinol oxidase subunit 2
VRAKDQFLTSVIAYLAGLVGLGIGRLVLNVAPLLQFAGAVAPAGAVDFVLERRTRGRRKVVAARTGRSRLFSTVVLFVVLIATQWLQLHYPESWPVVTIVALFPVLLLSQVLISWWQGDQLVESAP